MDIVQMLREALLSINQISGIRALTDGDGDRHMIPERLLEGVPKAAVNFLSPESVEPNPLLGIFSLKNGPNAPVKPPTTHWGGIEVAAGRSPNIENNNISPRGFHRTLIVASAGEENDDYDDEEENNTGKRGGNAKSKKSQRKPGGIFSKLLFWRNVDPKRKKRWRCTCGSKGPCSALKAKTKKNQKSLCHKCCKFFKTSSKKGPNEEKKRKRHSNSKGDEEYDEEILHHTLKIENKPHMDMTMQPIHSELARKKQKETRNSKHNNRSDRRNELKKRTLSSSRSSCYKGKSNFTETLNHSTKLQGQNEKDSKSGDTIDKKEQTNQTRYTQVRREPMESPFETNLITKMEKAMQTVEMSTTSINQSDMRKDATTDPESDCSKMTPCQISTKETNTLLNVHLLQDDQKIADRVLIASNLPSSSVPGNGGNLVGNTSPICQEPEKIERIVGSNHSPVDAAELAPTGSSMKPTPAPDDIHKWNDGQMVSHNISKVLSSIHGPVKVNQQIMVMGKSITVTHGSECECDLCATLKGIESPTDITTSPRILRIEKEAGGAETFVTHSDGCKCNLCNVLDKRFMDDEPIKDFTGSHSNDSLYRGVNESSRNNLNYNAALNKISVLPPSYKENPSKKIKDNVMPAFDRKYGHKFVDYSRNKADIQCKADSREGCTDVSLYSGSSVDREPIRITKRGRRNDGYNNRQCKLCIQERKINKLNQKLYLPNHTDEQTFARKYNDNFEEDLKKCSSCWTQMQNGDYDNNGVSKLTSLKDKRTKKWRSKRKKGKKNINKNTNEKDLRKRKTLHCSSCDTLSNDSLLEKVGPQNGKEACCLYSNSKYSQQTSSEPIEQNVTSILKDKSEYRPYVQNTEKDLYVVDRPDYPGNMWPVFPKQRLKYKEDRQILFTQGLRNIEDVNLRSENVIRSFKGTFDKQRLLVGKGENRFTSFGDVGNSLEDNMPHAPQERFQTYEDGFRATNLNGGVTSVGPNERFQNIIRNNIGVRTGAQDELYTNYLDVDFQPTSDIRISSLHCVPSASEAYIDLSPFKELRNVGIDETHHKLRGQDRALNKKIAEWTSLDNQALALPSRSSNKSCQNENNQQQLANAVTNDRKVFPEAVIMDLE